MDKYILLVIIFFIPSSTAQADIDPIALLASCGNDCWKKENPGKENLTLTSEKPLDDKIVKCMQVCFSERTKQEDTEENLPPDQIKKIKVSSFCGYICYDNNKNRKRALDYCYAGCLGSILQPRKPPN